jgi:hypothetical protein
MIHSAPSPTTIFTTPAPFRKRKSFQRSTSLSPSFWTTNNYDDSPKVAIGCLPAQRNSFESRKLMGCLPRSSSEHWVSFHKRFQKTHRVERSLRRSGRSNSNEYPDGAAAQQEGILSKITNRIFSDCSNPHNDEPDEWVVEVPSKPYLELRNANWHFWKEEKVDHDYNLIE